MSKFVVTLLNISIIALVVLVAFGISTYALSKKMTDYNNATGIIAGTIDKKDSIIIAEARGNVSKVYYNEGEKVKEGDKIVELTNPELDSKIKVLSAATNNLSAKTELAVASQAAQQLEIVSPVSGYVSEVNYSEGETVNPSDRLYTIYTNEDTRFYVELSDQEYKQVMNLDSITAYSDRLSQFIELNFSNLSPDKKINPDDNQSKIGVFFSLKNKEDGENLLHNEEMTLLLDDKREFTSKPFDIINGVWSKILSVN